MERLVLKPVQHISGTIKLPGSKSLTNRALLISALAQGVTELHNPLASDDTKHMVAALRALGCAIEQTEAGYRVTGVDGAFNLPTTAPKNAPLALFLGNAGTAMRPLAAALTLKHQGRQPCSFALHGDPRMHERPIGDLVDSLKNMGADITYQERDGYPPLQIRSTGLAGGKVGIRGDRSSQYLTALLMTAPFADDPVDIEVTGELVSKPYIDITIALMARFKVHVEQQGYRYFHVPVGGPYRSPHSLVVEGDASSASYFLAAGAIRGGTVRVVGVGKPALQGDAAFAEVLGKMGAKVRYGQNWISVAAQGALQGVDLDLNQMPDAAMTLATTALFAQTPTRIRNIANWKIKETDRLHAMAVELRKLGARVTTTTDSLTIEPPAALRSAEIATWEDHRMAMSFSLAALGDATITIQNPACVNKTFPNYFSAFASLCNQSTT